MIELDNVTVSYGDTQALKPTRLCFRQGLFHVLLGASGAGKSTLLRCLNLMQTPGSGTIHINGKSNWHDKIALRALRRKTGMIFQQHQLIERQTVLKNVLMGRYGSYGALRSLFPLSARDEVIAMRSLKLVGMEHKALSRVDELSGGQQQRVGIARALAQEPETLLADEPVASLDPKTADRVMSLIHGICRHEGLTAVVSLHQVELAKRYADWIVGLSHGRVVFEGAPEDLNETAIRRIYGGAAVSDDAEASFASAFSLEPVY